MYLYHSDVIPAKAGIQTEGAKKVKIMYLYLYGGKYFE
jgi:hypothetical protein